jgi:ribosomal protein S18 acetylase RimI-like enzyme
MLSEIDAFHPEEVSCALELADLSLRDPEGTGYTSQVAELDGELAAWVCYGPTPLAERTWDLYWVASSAKARGKGAGYAVVKAMEAELARLGARTVRIETSSLTEYGPARSFYARLHYSEAARIEDFYRPGDDLVILSRRLDEPA